MTRSSTTPAAADGAVDSLFREVVSALQRTSYFAHCGRYECPYKWLPADLRAGDVGAMRNVLGYAVQYHSAAVVRRAAAAAPQGVCSLRDTDAAFVTGLARAFMGASARSAADAAAVFLGDAPLLDRLELLASMIRAVLAAADGGAGGGRHKTSSADTDADADASYLDLHRVTQNLAYQKLRAAERRHQCSAEGAADGGRWRQQQQQRRRQATGLGSQEQVSAASRTLSCLMEVPIRGEQDRSVCCVVTVTASLPMLSSTDVETMEGPFGAAKRPQAGEWW